MKINTVIFDLDGTLLNTLEDLTDSVNYGLTQLDYPQRTLEEINSFVGNGVKVLIEKALPAKASSKDIEQCLHIFRDHYSNNMRNKTKPYEGVCEVLKVLKEKNYRLAVVSNKFDAAVKMLCEEYFSDFIKTAIGESSNVNRKPAPDSVYRAMDVLGSKKEECIYVGDSEVDVKTAHNAGIKCIGVTWGFRGRQVLESEGSDFIVDSPKEILDVL